MVWWMLAAFSGFGLATRNLAFKVASGKIDAALGALILSIGMAAVSIGYVIYDRYAQGAAAKPFHYTKEGILLALVAGAGVALANITLAYSYKVGGPASLVAIVQQGLAISVTVLIGIWLLGEAVRPLQVGGIVVAAIGILMIVRG